MRTNYSVVEDGRRSGIADARSLTHCEDAEHAIANGLAVDRLALLAAYLRDTALEQVVGYFSQQLYIYMYTYTFEWRNYGKTYLWLYI